MFQHILHTFQLLHPTMSQLTERNPFQDLLSGISQCLLFADPSQHPQREIAVHFI